MQYFVTGATGFIGKRLVKTLLGRKGAVVHFLVRPGSEGKLAALYEYWGIAAKTRALPVSGDLTARKLGVSAEAIKALKGKIDAIYHLAAVYDLSADAESQVQVNIEGTRNMVEFAKAIDAGHVHHVSSIAAAGLYEGVFREGYMGVPFFFILSGFILSHSYAERLRQGMTYRQFLVTRLARIYPLHLLTLFIAFPIALASLVSGKRSLSIFLEGLIANLALLQAFSPVLDIHFSMNAPSWSISNEMFFYAMFPILVSSRSAYLFGTAVAILLTQQVIGNFADENTAHFLVYVFPPSRIADFVIGILLHRFFSRTRPPAASLATGLQVGSLTIFALCVTSKALIPQHARYDLYYIPAMSLIIISFAWQDGMRHAHKGISHG